MTQAEFNMLRMTTQELITRDDLSDISDRTLLFGRMSDRSQFHVYLKDRRLHVLSYKVAWKDNIATPVDIQEIKPSVNTDYVPDNKVYPERSDFEFCQKLIDAGVAIPFTNWVSDSFNIAKKHNQFDDSDYYGFTW